MHRLSLFLLVFSALVVSAFAGGGPAGTIVLYDPSDVNSVTVANQYQRVRDIPERNMIPFVFPASFTRTTSWDFIYSIRQTLAARKIDQQLQCIALATASLPENSVQTTPTGNVTSIHSFIYTSPTYGQANFPTSIFSNTNTAYSATAANFRGPAPMGTQALSGTKVINGKTFWPVSSVGVFGKSALSPKETLAYIERAKSHDAAHPDGTVYWPLQSDIRSTTREFEINDVTEIWRVRGIKSWISGDSSLLNGWVKDAPDVVGGMVGSANPKVFNGNTYLPGAWVDHLTSNGGEWNTFNPGQLPATAWLRAGVDGSSGSMNEPYAYSSKFPHASIYTHFRAGSSLAEAFWQSIQTPGEIICAGDPLLQPYADFPMVNVSAPGEGATVAGTIAIAASASPTGGKTLAAELDLFVDGRRIAIGSGTENVLATRTPTGFTLNTATVGDGWHDLRVVAYNADAVRTQSEAKVTVIVNNAGQSLTLTGPATLNPDSSQNFTVGTAGLADLTSLTIQANGRTLATLPVGGGTANINLAAPVTFAPLDGTWTLFAVGIRSNGQQVLSAPLTTTISWPATPATPSPALGGALADVRYFSDTSAGGFDWDVTAPSVTATTAGDPAMGLYITGSNIAGVTITDYMTKKPGYQLDFWFYAPADDWYELGFSFGASQYTQNRSAFIDGQTLIEHDYRFQPRRLAAGWHTVRTRAAFNSASWASWEMRMRGGWSQDFIPVTRAMAASSGPGDPAQVPTITSITSPNPVTGTTVALTGNATVASGSPLLYHWIQQTGPQPVSFSANDSSAPATTATFIEAGDYTFALRVSGTAGGSAAATRTVNVARTQSVTPTLDKGLTASVFAGEPLTLFGFSKDQFGRRMNVTPTNPALPTLTWSASPAGTFTPLSTSGERQNFSSLTSGTATITATPANGRTGNIASTTVAVLPNSPPAASTRLITIAQTGVGNPITFTANVTDPENSSGIYLSYIWSVIGTPGGQTLTFASNGYKSVQAIASGPGTYTVQLDVMDQAGAALMGTQSFLVDWAGGATLPPATGGSIGFAGGTTATVAENGGSLSLTVRRSGLSTGAVSVNVVLFPGSATMTNDYLGFDGLTQSTVTLNWADGDTTDRIVSIPIVNNGTAENSETFSVLLNTVTGGADVPSPSTVTITIFDDDGPGVAGLLSATAAVRENDGNAVITVRRFGGSVGALTINYATTNATAISGQDYTSMSGSLSWANGETADKQITVPLMNDGSPEGDETFTLTLTASPTTLLGLIKVVTVTLKDSAYQQWQQTYWPGSFPSVNPVFNQTIEAIRSYSPFFVFRFAETAGTTVAGVNAAGTTVLTGTLAKTGTNNFLLNQVGPRAPQWPGLENTNAALGLTTSGSTTIPAQYSAGAYANLGTAAGLAAVVKNGFTFSAFVKTNITDRVMNIFGATGTAGVQFSVFANRAYNVSTTTTPHALRVYVRSDNNSIGEYSVVLANQPTGSLCDGQWHHIAITMPKFTGSSGTPNDNTDFPRFYFDGIEANALNVRGVEAIISTDTFTDFLYARIGASGAASVGAFFYGSLDEMAVIPKVLTPAEVARISTAAPLVPPPASAALGADGDFDGLINELEYALALNPLLPSVLPFAQGFVTIGTDDYLALTYTENVNATDVTKVVEVSSDLVNWNSGPSFTTLVNSNTVGTIRTVTVRDNVSSSVLNGPPTRFIRVNLSSVP